MTAWLSSWKGLVHVFLLCAAVAAGGCEGTDTRDKVDDTVEAMAGKKDLDRYQEMKTDLGEIQMQQNNRYRQVDEDTDNQ